MKHRPEYDMKVIGQNLRRLRKAKGLSVEDVREYLYLGSVQAYYKYERGAGYMTSDSLLALMELYDATIWDIVGNREEDLERSSSVVYKALFLNYAYNDSHFELCYFDFRAKKSK